MQIAVNTIHDSIEKLDAKEQHDIDNQFILWFYQQGIYYEELQNNIYDGNICKRRHLFVRYNNGIIWYANNPNDRRLDGELIDPHGGRLSCWRNL